jgi:transcriptional regulator with AAA-type ATPase domain
MGFVQNFANGGPFAISLATNSPSFSGLRLGPRLQSSGIRDLEMPRIGLSDSTQDGRQAEHLENKFRHLVIGQDEAIHQIVRAYQTHLEVGRPIGNFLFLGPTGSGKTRMATHD